MLAKMLPPSNLLFWLAFSIVGLCGLIWCDKRFSGRRNLLAFIMGAWLAPFILFVYLPIYHHIADELALEKQVKMLMPALRPAMQRIEQYARQHHTLRDAEKLTFPPPDLLALKSFQVQPGGQIILRTQPEETIVLLVLTPSYQNGQVQWRCVGGPSHAVPSYCFPPNNLPQTGREK